MIIPSSPHPHSFEQDTPSASQVVNGVIESISHVTKQYGYSTHYGTKHCGNCYRG